MKNKKSLYILLPAAAGLWGYIIYLVVSGMGSGSGVAGSVQVPTWKADSLVLAKDSFVLNLTYDDPFLKKTKSSAPVTSNPKPVSSAPAKPPKKKEDPKPTATVSWPSITYGGSISGAGTKKEVVILIIGNEEILAKEGDVVKGIKINHIAPYVIGLEYQGAIKNISR